tara:strand:+ start:4361 stop:5458 length:1098 start_codon:yes stop_codon:yes gene_type:complete
LEKSKTNKKNETINNYSFNIDIKLLAKNFCKYQKQKDIIMDIENKFKTKAKILKKSLQIKQSEANELLSKLIGYSNFYEYQKNKDKNDGRLVYLSIENNNQTFSQKRIDFLINKAQELSVDKDLVIKLFGIKKVKSELFSQKSNNMNKLILSLLLNGYYDDKKLIIKSFLFSFFGFNKLFLEEKIKSQKKKSSILIIAKKMLLHNYKKLKEKYPDHNISFMSPEKVNKDLINKKFKKDYDYIFYECYEGFLVRKKDFQSVIKNKNITIILDSGSGFMNGHLQYAKKEKTFIDLVENNEVCNLIGINNKGFIEFLKNIELNEDLCVDVGFLFEKELEIFSKNNYIVRFDNTFFNIIKTPYYIQRNQ